MPWTTSPAWKRPKLDDTLQSDLSIFRVTSSPELHFIPGSLIRRDPETEVLVTKDQAVAALGTGLHGAIRRFQSCCGGLLRTVITNTWLLRPEHRKGYVKTWQRSTCCDSTGLPHGSTLPCG